MPSVEVVLGKRKAGHGGSDLTPLCTAPNSLSFAQVRLRYSYLNKVGVSFAGSRASVGDLVTDLLHVHMLSPGIYISR